MARRTWHPRPVSNYAITTIITNIMNMKGIDDFEDEESKASGQ